MVWSQCEERLFFVKGEFDLPKKMTVGLLHRVACHPWILLLREECFSGALLLLALHHVGPAALHHDFAKEFVAEQYLTRLDGVGREEVAKCGGGLPADDGGKVLLQ